jgi:LacI family repressor for deo operon, udp, cdd, tsx, nupC, and nupG
MCKHCRVIPKKPVAMKDVATRLGLSISTVSRALNGRPGVAEPTRQKVLAESQALAYVISPATSAVTGSRTGRIGIVTPRADVWYYSSVIAGAEEKLREHGIETILHCLPTESERRDFFSELPLQHSVDGLIVVSFPVGADDPTQLDRLRTPVVSVSVRFPGVPFVSIDDRLAAIQAVSHLTRIGHRRIAMIRTVDPDGLPWAADLARTEGYIAALANSGIEGQDELIVTAPWGIDGGAEAMERLLSLVAPPTAVFCLSDEVAIGALRTLRRSGISVPETMSVIAIDDHPMAELTDLTTIAQPARQLGEIAAEMVIAAAAGEGLDDVVLPTRLVARHTTAPPPAA